MKKEAYLAAALAAASPHSAEADQNQNTSLVGEENTISQQATPEQHNATIKELIHAAEAGESVHVEISFEELLNYIPEENRPTVEEAFGGDRFMTNVVEQLYTPPRGMEMNPARREKLSKILGLYLQEYGTKDPLDSAAELLALLNDTLPPNSAVENLPGDEEATTKERMSLLLTELQRVQTEFLETMSKSRADRENETLREAVDSLSAERNELMQKVKDIFRFTTIPLIGSDDTRARESLEILLSADPKWVEVVAHLRELGGIQSIHPHELTDENLAVLLNHEGEVEALARVQQLSQEYMQLLDGITIDELHDWTQYPPSRQKEIMEKKLVELGVVEKAKE